MALNNKIFILLLGSTIILGQVWGQFYSKDSLLHIFHNLNLDDSLRIDAVSRYAYRMFEKDTVASNKWYDSAFLLSNQKNKHHLLAIPLSSKALVRVNNGMYEQALPIWSDMHSYTEKINDQPGLGNALYGKALTYYYMQDFDTSIYLQEKALKLFQALNRPDKMVSCYNNLASSYLMMGNYSMALEKFLIANNLSKEIKDTVIFIVTLGNVGMVYKYLEKYEYAFDYYRKSYSLSKQTGNRRNEADMLQKMGTVLDAQDSSIAAIELYRQALAINLANGYERASGENLCNIGIGWFETGNYDSAWIYLKKSLPILKKYGDQRAQGTVLSYLGKTLLNASGQLLTKLGYSEGDVLGQSKKYHQKALEIFKSIKTPYNEASEWEALANIYQREGNYKLALDAMTNLMVLRDSIFKDETKEKILEKELAYEQAKREAVLKAEYAAEIGKRELTQKATMAGAGLALLSMAGIYALNRKRLKANARSIEADLNTEKIKLENKALRSQMNPHFLFNALNGIAGYIRKHEANLAEEYLTKFARLMRLVLENSEKEEVSLSAELEALEIYVELESVRLGKAIEYIVEIDHTIDLENTQIPPLLLQPFVENSIWHGIMPKKGGGKILINIDKKGEEILIAVEDNGVGLLQGKKSNHDTKSPSMGIRLTERRIQLLKGQPKSTEKGIEVEELSEGFRVSLRIPFMSLC
jgi:tetratricopeptide (TPR) repeat protein